MKQGNEKKLGSRNEKPRNLLWWHRKKIGYSQKVVAKLLGHKSTTHISDYERGKRLPSLKTALKLEIILCTPIAFLYHETYTQLKQDINHRREQLTKAERNG